MNIRDLRLEGILTDKILSGPETVHIDLTNKCNLHCLYCWNHSPLLKKPKSVSWKQEELKFSLILQLLNELEELDVKKIILSGGGEPFLYPKIEELIYYIKKKNFHLTILTNFTLVHPIRISELGVDRLLIHLSSASAETYKKLHPPQTEEDFEKLLNNLQLIQLPTRFNLVQVISQFNYKEINKMIDLAIKFNANRISFKLMSTIEGTEKLALNTIARNELLNELIPLAKEYTKRYNLKTNLKVLESQITNSEYRQPLNDIGCYAGWYYSRIYLTGDVFFCCKHFKMGNVYSNSFREIWYSDIYQNFRERIKLKDFPIGCSQCGKYDLNYKINKILRGIKIKKM